MQTNLPALLPQYQHWVDQWVMTELEAQQLQFLMEAAMEGEAVDAPQLGRAIQNLALHSLVDEETAIRH